MMKRTISTPALLFASISAILGSGWLFAAFYTSILAGPSAMISWIIGGGIVIVIAFVFAELSAMIPIMGSSTRIPQYTHGTLVSFIFSWMIWLSYMAIVPTEVQAVIQYLSYYFPTLVHANGGLTHLGYVAATVLMFFVSTLNIFSLRWLLRCNNALTILKLILPLAISIIILLEILTATHRVHVPYAHFMPFGLHGMLAAVTSGGIVFAFNGFKQACEMAGEAKNPSRSIPFAIVGSVVICLILYLILQIAFLMSLTHHNLTQGWAHLLLSGNQSPFVSIVNQDRLSWLVPIIYVGAIVAPLAAALMYANSSARSLFGKSSNGYLPAFLQKLSPQGNPVYAIIVNFFLGMCLFAPLPGWDKMVTFLTSLMAVSYAIAPVCLMTMRKQLPDMPRPIKLPFPALWSFLAFYFCTLLTYWSGWFIVSKLSISLVISLAILFIYHFGSKRGRQIVFNWRESIWVWPYFIGITVISYYGEFNGGRDVITFGWDFVTIALFCVFILYLSQRVSLPKAETQAYIDALKLSTTK